MQERNFKWLDVFTVAFVTMLLLSNIIASKLVNWLGITGTAAMYLFPLTYIFGDILVEVYGYAKTRRIIWLGFLYAVALPSPSYYEGQAAFALVLGSVPRIVLFSILGYWVGSFTNSFILARMKEWMVHWDPRHKFLALRTISSTLCGEFVDSCIFIIGAFIGNLPVSVVITMVFVQWAVKCSVEILMTPATYFIIKGVKKIENIDAIGTETYNPFAINKE